MSWLRELKVGDQVFVVGNRPGDRRYVTVGFVGRKWLTMKDYFGRIDLTQDLVNGRAFVSQEYGSAPIVYRSEDDYLRAVTMSKLRKAVIEEISYRGVSDEDIHKIADILGIKVPQAPYEEIQWWK